MRYSPAFFFPHRLCTRRRDVHPDDSLEASTWQPQKEKKKTKQKKRIHQLDQFYSRRRDKVSEHGKKRPCILFSHLFMNRTPAPTSTIRLESRRDADIHVSRKAYVKSLCDSKASTSLIRRPCAYQQPNAKNKRCAWKRIRRDKCGEPTIKQHVDSFSLCCEFFFLTYRRTVTYKKLMSPLFVTK